MFSDIVADVSGHIHGCFNSSISENIDIYFAFLHEINTVAATILNDRRSKIAAEEKSLIDRFIHQRDEIIKVLLKDGCSYANQYEEQYRRLIEEFIKILEIEMSKQLDHLQEEIEADKQSILGGININIKRITEEADKARNEFDKRIQPAIKGKRQEIMQMIDIISQDKTKQTLGYEQIRNVKVDIYSTVGMKTDDNCCEEIVTRKKFIKDIKEAKPHQPALKRTVYLRSDFAAQKTNRPNP
jgi:paraquat-inducible protein B